MNLTSTRRSQNVAEGGWARVMSADGHIWSARVTYVSGELVGLRGGTIVDGRFAENDKVTVLVGSDETLVSIAARVLRASGTLMRVVRRSWDGPEGLRRAARVPVRVPVRFPVELAFAESGEASTPQIDPVMIDLSTVGCALQVTLPLPTGARVRIRGVLGGMSTALVGTVVRGWQAGGAHFTGVEFDPLEPEVTRHINQVLVAELRRLAAPAEAR